MLPMLDLARICPQTVNDTPDVDDQGCRGNLMTGALLLHME